MANYPKFELVDNEKNYLDHVWSTKLWDVSQMPSKLYMRNKDGSLVAIRPIFFVSLKNDKEYVCGTSEVFGFEKAGEGLCIKRVDTYLPSYDFFVSPEDYERYKASGDGAYQIPILLTTDILREYDYNWTSNGILVWQEKNGEPKNALIPDYRLWIDRDGAHIEPLTTKAYFKTSEECARTIPKAQVVDFDEPEQEPEGIMDTTNGHPEDLVRRINVAWVRCKEEFEPILKALYERDIDEITDHDAFRIPAWEDWPEYHHGCNTNDWTAYNKLALETMKEKWDEYAENYLMHVADGKDLQCILDFVRG